MTWILLLLAVSMTVLLGAVVRQRRRRSTRCASCGADMAAVAVAGEGPNATYDVLACLRCPETAVYVDGCRAAGPAPCPACRHATLDVRTMRLAGFPPRVGVRESCDFCGHERSYTVSARDEAPAAKVIAFPTGAARRPKAQSGDGT